uniref:Inhibitor_I29 domain-containing protein n=1 Tax=Rhabditophanes sp. KR3021 TaxID=114890 RepID=A0AC35U5P1_9BILA
MKFTSTTFLVASIAIMFAMIPISESFAFGSTRLNNGDANKMFALTDEPQEYTYPMIKKSLSFYGSPNRFALIDKQYRNKFAKHHGTNDDGSQRFAFAKRSFFENNALEKTSELGGHDYDASNNFAITEFAKRKPFAKKAASFALLDNNQKFSEFA